MIREELIKELRLAGWDLLTIQEVAVVSRQTYVTVWRHINEGKLPFVKMGGSIRIRRDDAIKYFGGNPDEHR